MLVGAGGDHPGVGTFLDLGQATTFVVGIIVAAFFVDGQIAIKQHDLTGSAQGCLAVGALQIDGGALDAGSFHLRGDHPLPDQFIEAAEIALQAKRAGVSS